MKSQQEEEFLAFKAKHRFAYKALRDYSDDCEIDENMLRPFLAARTRDQAFAHINRVRRYTICSALIEQLVDGLVGAPTR